MVNVTCLLDPCLAFVRCGRARFKKTVVVGLFSSASSLSSSVSLLVQDAGGLGLYDDSHGSFGPFFFLSLLLVRCATFIDMSLMTLSGPISVIIRFAGVCLPLHSRERSQFPPSVIEESWRNDIRCSVSISILALLVSISIHL